MNDHQQRPSLLSSLGKAACYFILFFGWQVIVMSVYLAVQMAVAMETGGDIWTAYDLLFEKSFELGAISNLLTLFSVVVIMKVRRKSLRQELWLRPVSGKLLGWCAAFSFCLYWLVTLVLAVLPESVMAGYDEAAMGLADTGFVVVVSTALISPVVEEVIFRGLIYTRLERSMRPATAAAVSALVFAFCHGQAVWVCYAYALGLLFALVTRHSRSILPALLMHVVFNTTNEVLVLLGDWEPGIVGGILICLVGVGGSAFCARRVWALAMEQEKKVEEAVPAEPVREYQAEVPAAPARPAPAAWDTDSGIHHRFPPERM